MPAIQLVQRSAAVDDVWSSAPHAAFLSRCLAGGRLSGNRLLADGRSAKHARPEQFAGIVEQDLRPAGGAVALAHSAVWSKRAVAMSRRSWTSSRRPKGTAGMRRQSRRARACTNEVLRTWRLTGQCEEEVVGVRGFEPPTPASRTQYSTRLSYTPTTAVVGQLNAAPATPRFTVASSTVAAHRETIQL